MAGGDPAGAASANFSLLLHAWPFGFSTSRKMAVLLAACAALTQSAAQTAAAATAR